MSRLIRELHGRGRIFGWAVLLICAFSACSKSEDRHPVVPVRGQVFVNKKPAEHATVILHPLDPGEAQKSWPQGFPRASVAADGSFAIGTYEAGDGAPSGKYAVLFEWRRSKSDQGEEVDIDLLRGRYSNPKSSTYKIEVKDAAIDLGVYHLSK